MHKKKHCGREECPWCNPDKYDEVALCLESEKFEQFKNCYFEHKVKLVWCRLCMSFYVECPHCGNNSCNAGYGDDPDNPEEKCSVCPDAYELQKKMYESGCMDILERMTGLENVREEYRGRRKLQVEKANKEYEAKEKAKENQGKSK